MEKLKMEKLKMEKLKMEKTHTDLKKFEDKYFEDKYIKLRTDYILKMTKEEKEDEVKDCLMYHYGIL